MPDQTLPERLRVLAARLTDGVSSVANVEVQEALTGAADELERLEREAHPLHEIGRELAGDAGVASPMPQPRRFAARYADAVTGRPFAVPTPGSFVLLGPVGSTWRVLAVDELAGHGSATHVLDLEAVDAHDVPVQARVEAVPMPVEEFEPAEVTA